MKVKIHKLFEYLLETTAAEPEAVLGFSLATSPQLGDFLEELDPTQSLDWSNESFLGLPSLRQHILERANLESTCQLDDVLITAGAAEANYLAIMQLVQPGDEIIFDMPGWPQPRVLARAIGAEMRVMRRVEAVGWQLDIDALEAAISPRTKLIFLSNPNNPSGHLLGREELERIARAADKVGAYLLVDEVYAGLEWNRERAPSIAGLYERGITTGSVSKSLGLQGLRTGWIICRDASVIEDAYILRENSSEIMNVMGERIAEIAMRQPRYDAAIARALAEGRANLQRLNAFIDQRPELSWIPPEAGLIGLCRLNLSIDGEQLARRLLAPPYRTFLLPGSAYDCPQYIRLGVGGGAEVALETGLGRLGALLDEIARSD